MEYRKPRPSGPLACAPPNRENDLLWAIYAEKIGAANNQFDHHSPNKFPGPQYQSLKKYALGYFPTLLTRSRSERPLPNLRRVATVLLHSIESTWLMAVLLDHSDVRREVNGSSFLGVRQAYALAIVRTVNGLVDPI
ncbi:uncharacterized protein EI90DRAFT_3129108 [Cantharellus anzutake]|uniref:uncharacterized protein n=1 Tax=Cantharellus anzutake TaxID=1750568 RepID=UPI00190791C3|nr:uncharacterized protein EI90DRAFT_3129108 [Cantharellus anzutake]KAF8325048.1 hypothetical protein EI90DRAFT_3129108 [Cantharellus anzutake]